MLGVAATTITIRCGTRPGDIETVRGTWRQTVELLHDGPPFMTMRTGGRSIEMKDQPVRHLVRHDVFHERLAILAQQDRIEA